MLNRINFLYSTLGQREKFLQKISAGRPDTSTPSGPGRRGYTSAFAHLDVHIELLRYDINQMYDLLRRHLYSDLQRMDWDIFRQGDAFSLLDEELENYCTQKPDFDEFMRTIEAGAHGRLCQHLQGF